MKTKRMGEFSNRMYGMVLVFAIFTTLFAIFSQNGLTATEVRINFTTTGDSTTMRCDFVGTATAIWHWSDGNTTTAVSGATVTKNGLGVGAHQNYLTVSDGSALTRFGAGNAGEGHLVSLRGLQNCPNMAILYTYQENSLTSIGDVSTTVIREYHLMNTGLGAVQMDGIFADAVASGVQGGTLWADNSGTSASDADKATLQAGGWTLNIPAWTPQTPTPTGEVRIDFITAGDSTTMRCDFSATATAIWHWSDGTTTAAVSGASVTKSGLGVGAHLNYLTVSNGPAITRFGAGIAGQGHLILISGLQNCPNMAILYAYQENSLTSIGNTSSTMIREYHLMNTGLSAAELDGIFADAVASGVQGGTLWADNSGTSACDADIAILQTRGWTLNIPSRTSQPTPTTPPSAGEVRIDFTTTGNSTTMSCDFGVTATAIWHWSDGTTTAALSGTSVTKSGLGEGVHLNYLTVSNGSALTRFGAGSAGLGHLLSISGLQNCPYMAMLYAYQENSLASIGDVSTTVIREYHLMNTGLDAVRMDGVFADAVASGVQAGTLWADNSGTSASDTDKATLQARGWTLNIPAWIPQTPTPTAPPPAGEVRIDFTTTGDSTTMSCDFGGTATANWHWADGTTTTAVSGAAVTKSGMGFGAHQNYLTISQGPAITRFGAGNTGQGNLVTINGLQNCPNMAILYAYQENSLTSIGDTATAIIREYHLMNTSLSAAEMDGIFADAVTSGVQAGTLWADNSGTSASDAAKATLQARGWTLNIPAWSPQTPTPTAPTPTSPPSTGEVRIDFITAGDSTTMNCDFGAAATAIWRWADGTTTAAISGAPVTKSGLGEGAHLNYLTVSNGLALTRFGAANAGQGHLVSISGLQSCPNMAILYVYQENSLTSIGNASSAIIREYHLMNTNLNAAEMDGIFADAVASGVQSGILWADNSGTSASDTDKATLQAGGWTLNIPVWTPQPTPTVPPPTGEVRINFTTMGDSTAMRCDFGETATAVWRWADGTTTTAVSGASVTKSGLGTGVHQNYLTVSNGLALTRFGAGNAGQGHLVTINGLQNCPNTAILYAYQENSLTSIGNTSSVMIREYHLMNTGVSAVELDGIFADAVVSGVQAGTLWADNSGTSASDTAKATLQARGWTLNIPAWTPQPTPTAGEARINFTTTGDSTTMSCDFGAIATAIWHWADGTTTAAVSGAPVTKSGLGEGAHLNFLTVSTGSALTRFGAGNAGQGHLVSISGLQNCPNMAILYAYQESSLTSIGDTSATIIREYHLMGTSLSAAGMDGIFANAVASGVQGGTLWGDNSGTSSSNAVKTILQSRGWILSIPAWTPQSTEEAITFITEGRVFEPVIQVTGNAQITWTFADGTTSSSNTPVKDYGSAGTRTATLVVTPWSAVTRINIGYDAGDSGSNSIEFVPDQHVSAVFNLNLVAPYLRQWCSSYNQLTSLDFSNFTQLDTIECYLSRSLRSVNLTNTPELKRICFEDCDLLTLDVSQCPKLEDLRGAVNRYSTIQFGSVGGSTWHICIRDNQQMTDQSLFQDMSRFPNIAELFIWNDNQAGSIRIPSTSLNRGIALLANGNRYTSLNLQGALQLSNSIATVDFSNNLLTNVDLTGCTQITNLNLQNNQLSASEADEILAALDSLGRTRANTPSWADLYVDISGGGNQQPSQAGYTSALNLSSKGWTVVAAGWNMQPYSL